MGILSWIVAGLIVGMLAKFVMTGSEPGGMFITIVLDVVGAVVGGCIGTRVCYGDLSVFNMGSSMIAVGSAVLLLVGYGLVGATAVSCFHPEN